MAALSFYKEHHATPLVVDLTGKTFDSIEVSQCSGLHFVGGEFVPAEVKAQVSISRSSDVWFSDASMVANLKAFGFLIADSQDVRVTGCRIDRAFQGINAGRCDNLVIDNNEITGQGNDGIVIYRLRKGEITNNSISASLRQSGKHPDGVQFIFELDNPKHAEWTEDVLIAGNMLCAKAQLLFGNGLKNCIIRDNMLKGTHIMGIGFGPQTINLLIEGNWLQTLPGSKTQCLITVKGEHTRRGNRVAGFGRHAAIIDPA